MKRKIIKLAEKTLVVSLPSSWVNAQGLKKGDELQVMPPHGEFYVESDSKASKKEFSPVK